MKLQTIKTRLGGAEIDTLTVGTVRRLLALSARRRVAQVDQRVTNATARKTIHAALRGRASGGPVSLLVANLATELAGLQPAQAVR